MSDLNPFNFMRQAMERAFNDPRWGAPPKSSAESKPAKPAGDG